MFVSIFVSFSVSVFVFAYNYYYYYYYYYYYIVIIIIIGRQSSPGQARATVWILVVTTLASGTGERG